MPKPVLQAMVLADHVYKDRSTGKHIIAGTFTNILFGHPKVESDGPTKDGGTQQVVRGPITKAGSPYLYIALVEVHGQVPLELKYVDLSDARVLFHAEMAVSATDPLSVAEYIIPMPSLPSGEHGHYSLDLLHDGEILGSWRVSVNKIDNSGEKQ